MRVIKRSGEFQPFNIRKIQLALAAAYQDALNYTPDLTFIYHRVASRVFDLGRDVKVEEIQDLIEQEIPDELVLREYIRYRAKKEQAREQRLTPDNKAISDYVIRDKYTGGMSWEDNCMKLANMHIKKYPHLERQILDAIGYVIRKEVFPSMRSLQFAGEAIEAHELSMYNCAFTHIDQFHKFRDVFYALLCGTGVGYSVQYRHVNQLPKLKKIDKTRVTHHTVEDTIEGWALALEALMNSYLTGEYIEFNYSNIRPEGSLLKTRGGVAPGHLELKYRLEKVRSILDEGSKLRPIQVNDILCHIAESVRAGGIRRSSLMCLFSPEDSEMVYAKTGNWPLHRRMANNSVVLKRDCDKELFKRIMDVNEEFGEPGFFFTENLDWGCNPCGEIGLDPGKGFGLCNLSEIIGPHVKDNFYDCCRVAAFFGTLQAGYTNIKFLNVDTVKRDALLGVSITGIQSCPWLICKDKLQNGVEIVKRENERVAKLIGINPAARLTTIKPSGTASLAATSDRYVESGIHLSEARRFFRRVKATGPVRDHFAKYNPHMLEESPFGENIVFPIQVPPWARLKEEVTGCEFVDDIFFFYDNWVRPGSFGPLTHNVSCTVTIHPGERDRLMDKIWENRHRIAAMSFAPLVMNYAFAPFEKADERRWNYLIENYREVDWTNYRGPIDPGSACEGASCGIL